MLLMLLLVLSKLRKYFSLKDNIAHINLYIYKKFI